MSLAINVIPTLDSQFIDSRKFQNAKIFYGNIENEVKPILAPKCFLGAWYRKVFSSFDYWLGMEGVIKLGEFTPDKLRFNLDGKGRYMDNPSIYMGGKSAKETDAGLNLNLSYLSDDTKDDLVLSSPKLAYRPFWRYIYNTATDVSGNVERHEINSWNVHNPRHLGNYYFPGDVIKMSVYSPMKDYLQLRIDVIEPTTNPKYVKIRNGYNLENNLPTSFLSPLFFSKGHGYEKAEFKRVNSIDQYGNEGFVAQNTNAEVSEAVWQEVYLYKEIDKTIYKIPFLQSRQTSMICPNTDAITVKNHPVDPTGESVIIHPGKRN
ncbi:MAG: hypothetical protein AB7V00_01235 [Bacilli bacterium]